MGNWAAVVRERLARLDGDGPEPVLVDELSAHLAHAYDEARDNRLSDEDARTRALAILDASDLLRNMIAARRPGLPQRVSEWSRQEPRPPEKGAWMSPVNLLRDGRYAL